MSFGRTKFLEWKFVCCLLILLNLVFFFRANEPCLSEVKQEMLELKRADRSLFIQDLTLSTLGAAAFRRRPRPISSSSEPVDERAAIFGSAVRLRRRRTVTY